MLDLRCPDDFLPALEIGDECDARHFAPRIDLEREGLDHAAFTLLEDDRERIPSKDRRLAFIQKLLRPRRVAGHQRLFLAIQHENTSHFRPLEIRPVTGTVPFRDEVRLDDVGRAYHVRHTDLDPQSFNAGRQSGRLAMHPPVS